MIARIKEFLGMEAQPKEVASKQEVEKVAEEKAKPRIGYIHLSGCTGDVMSLSENYDILAPLLTEMVDIVYGQTLADVWEMPEMDVALVEGSVCLQDEHSVKELMEAREKAGLVVALGSCAATVDNKPSQIMNHSCQSQT
jgi:coenzyme F420 hydrogenase subunit gamma